jgi:bifunctional DNA-binding transcriptional regulator/antitoxin component of YhaV-PrlF toxin-antitoxin module
MKDEAMSITSEKPLDMESITTVHLNQRGQITLPKALRQQQRLEAGCTLRLLTLGEGLLLLPEQAEWEALLSRIRDTLAKTGRTADEILATLPAVRDRVFAELYGHDDQDELL